MTGQRKQAGEKKIWMEGMTDEPAAEMAAEALAFAIDLLESPLALFLLLSVGR